MIQPADLFGAGVTDDSARRNTRPELGCRPGNLAPVRAEQMKRPCIDEAGDYFVVALFGLPCLT
jgi:hypothetical protein